MAYGPPLNLPRRQGEATVWAVPQAPGSDLWDGQIVASRRSRIDGSASPISAECRCQLLRSSLTHQRMRSLRAPPCLRHGVPRAVGLGRLVAAALADRCGGLL